ncbi:MAG: DUF1002 domain-containing protein [Aerococcus sp.]|nr:DUF1002 domain-containing protein [Aerococcus sp.]
MKIPFKRRLMKLGVATAALFTFIGFSAQSAKADKVKIQPMFTYGESLNTSQFNQTKQLLGVANGTTEIPVAINELNGLLQDNYPYYQVYSSTYITPADNNGGVTVEIKTPDTITSITRLQYENAAITAGAVDVDIKVASAVPVDGSGALAGVYKAFQKSGKTLNSEAVGVAQDELNTAVQITADNKDKQGYSDESLNAAIADIKEQIQNYKDKNGGSIDNNQIQVIINNVINNYNLNGVLSDENLNQLNQLMQRFSKIELSDEQKQALSNLGDKIRETGQGIADKAKETWNNLSDDQKAEVTGLWDKIVQFVKDTWNSLLNIFN